MAQNRLFIVHRATKRHFCLGKYGAPFWDILADGHELTDWMAQFEPSDYQRGSACDFYLQSEAEWTTDDGSLPPDQRPFVTFMDAKE